MYESMQQLIEQSDRQEKHSETVGKHLHIRSSKCYDDVLSSDDDWKYHE